MRCQNPTASRPLSFQSLLGAHIAATSSCVLWRLFERRQARAALGTPLAFSQLGAVLAHYTTSGVGRFSRGAGGGGGALVAGPAVIGCMRARALCGARSALPPVPVNTHLRSRGEGQGGQVTRRADRHRLKA
jgi:hypothetical protein